MKNITAVQWLKTEIEKYGDPEFLAISWTDLDKLINQAKQMEKEQIIMAHCHNRCLNDRTYECSIKAFKNAEQYYNDTYGERKQE